MFISLKKVYKDALGRKYGPFYYSTYSQTKGWVKCMKTGSIFRQNDGAAFEDGPSKHDLITKCTPDGTPIAAAKKRLKRKWYVVLEFSSRHAARCRKWQLERDWNITNTRVVADLDLKGRGK